MDLALPLVIIPHKIMRRFQMKRTNKVGISRRFAVKLRLESLEDKMYLKARQIKH